MNCAGEERVKSPLTKAEKPLFYVHKYSNVIFLNSSCTMYSKLSAWQRTLLYVSLQIDNENKIFTDSM